MSVIDEIKSRIKLEELVAESFTLVGRGTTLSTKEHDSLKIRTDWQWFEWYSQGKRGDVLDWFRLVHRCSLEEAIQELARRAGVELQPLSESERVAVDEGRVRRSILEAAAAHYHRVLMNHPGAQGARAWCAGRGWTLETMRRERVGFVVDSATLPAADAVLATPSHNGDLSDRLPMGSAPDGEGVDGWERPLATMLRDAGLLSHPLAKAVLSIPVGMVVYVHRRRGRVVFLSGRSIEGRRHYALPAELAGAKQPYANEVDRAVDAVEARVLVEGPADAIALGQAGVEAVALCGLAESVMAEEWGEFSHVGLDNDKAGRLKGLDLALGMDPAKRLIRWDGAKDGAEWVKKQLLAPGQSLVEAIGRLLGDEAKPAVVVLAEDVRGRKGEERKEGIRELLRHFGRMDDLTAADLKPAVAYGLGEGISQFNRLWKAHLKEVEMAQPEAGEGLGKAVYSMGGFVGGWLFEQCVTYKADGSGETFYWTRSPEGEMERKQSLEVGSTVFIPYSPTLEGVISKRVLLFPSEMGRYGSDAELLNETRAFIHRWVDVDNFYEQLAAYYVFLTWVYDAFHLVPYLRAIGDTGTGKTRLMKTVGALCYRPMFLDGATSEAAVFHLIDMAHGTMVLDEADFPNSGFGALMTKILNVGNSKHNCILRMQTKADGTYTIVPFEVYGPKCIAGRALFEDRAVESRCLTYRTVGGRMRQGIKRNLNDAFYREAEALRNKFLAWRFQRWQPEIEVPDHLSDGSIEPRLDQVSMIIKAIITDATMLAQLTEFVREYNQRLITDRQLTVEAVVVQALAEIYFRPTRTLMGEEVDLSVKNICDVATKLLALHDPDEKLSPRKVGGLLNGLGLQDRVRTAKGNGRQQVVVPEDMLRALMRRFGVDEPERVG